MLRPFLFVLVAAALASQIPHVLGLTNLATDGRISDETGSMAKSSATRVAAENASTSPTGSVVLSADARGHFFSTFRLNGKPVEGMVDTGASSIAINETTARRIGFAPGNLDYRYRVSTANGTARAASVRLDRVEIGGIRIHDVDAMVLEDKALSGSLIGMTFLKRLSSFQVANGSLRLVQ